jgi:Protein of unknown function (DUF3995)
MTLRGLVDALLLLGAAILSIAALWHVYWVIGGKRGKQQAIPERDGMALFTPTPVQTLAAGSVIAAAAALYAAVGLNWPLAGVPQSWVAFAVGAAGLVFVARAIGDFNHVGVFNRGGAAAFAKADRLVYSPLCFLLGVTGLAAALLRLI